MGYAEQLEAWFGHLPLEVDDLLLLERFQLLALPDRAPPEALSVVLASEPRLTRFIEKRCPELTPFVAELVRKADRASDDKAEREHALVWELADWFVYQRFPEAYDEVVELRAHPAPLTEICEIDGRTIVDVGAGTGRLALELGRDAGVVFAVEPVARLREYIAAQASKAGLDSVYPLDGTLHRIPLPDSSADVLVTSRAIGWQLEDELTEIERVVAPGGWAVHLLGKPTDGPRTLLEDTLESRGYLGSEVRHQNRRFRRYAKRMA